MPFDIEHKLVVAIASSAVLYLPVILITCVQIVVRMSESLLV